MPRPEPALTVGRVPTPWGTFVAHFSPAGLARLEFPNPGTEDGPQMENAFPPWWNQTREALQAVTLGKAVQELPPLDLRAGTEFQRRVWLALLNIPTGQTKTYGDLARNLGQPGASRAVGAACGANPIPVFIPCHRVLASHGKLGGFSGGRDWKERLLQAEGQLLA